MIGLMIAGFTAGCVKTDDIEIVALKSEKVNLQGYKTYQVIDESGFFKDPSVSDNLDLNIELQQIINAELAKKGKMPVTKNPDFYVAYLAAADMDAIKEKVDEKGQMKIESAPTAAMLLTLIDADTAEIIYLSTAEGDVKGLPLDEKRKRLSYAIKEMLGAM
jgi:uncharacterized membrane protein YkoI